MIRAFLGLVGLVALGGLHQAQEADLFFTETPDPEDLVESSEPLRLEIVREFGDLDEGLVFGNILDVAVSESGTLAVLDEMGCQIWLVDRETGQGHTIGRCGEGPGEFRGPHDLSFIGDTLLVWDWRGASMMKLAMDGEEIERFHVNPFKMGAATFIDLHMSEDGSVLASLQLLPNRMSSEHRQLAVMGTPGGPVVHRGLEAPPLAKQTPRNMVRSISSCVFTGGDGEEVILAVNHWGPQAAFLRRSDLELRGSVRIPVDWARAHEDADKPGHWGSMAPPPRVACGDRFAVIGYRKLAWGSGGEIGGEIEVSSAAMVLVDLREGAFTAMGGDEAPAPGSVLFMTPGAASGDRFFFYTNSSFGYPTVREYRLIRGGTQP